MKNSKPIPNREMVAAASENRAMSRTTGMVPARPRTARCAAVRIRERADGAAGDRVGATALGGEAEAVAGEVPKAGVAGSAPRGTCSTVMERTLVAGWRRRPPG